MQKLKIYIAGKVSKESFFGTHYWREDFVSQLEKLSGINLISIDPARKMTDQNDFNQAFQADVFTISRVDVVVVYLSNDISVGGSQEILIAKYFRKPVIGLAPLGGKFNMKNKHIFGQVIKNYKHPFVYQTCDVVCNDIEAVADTIKNLKKIKIKSIDLIGEAAKNFEKEHLKHDKYLSGLLD
jgi:hypothetical protein